MSEDRLNVEDFRNTTLNNLRRMQAVHDPEYMEPDTKVTTEALTRLIEGRVVSGEEAAEEAE